MQRDRDVRLMCVCRITETFFGASAFNVDISAWDTSRVTNLYRTFQGATSFNCDISAWDVSRVGTLYCTPARLRLEPAHLYPLSRAA